MAIRISGFLMFISFLFSAANGTMPALSEAALGGSSKAVTLTLSLLGMMCLWSGIMKVLEHIGALGLLSKLLLPILKLIFPNAAKNGRGIKEISAAIAANFLGIGNASTPLSVAAMQALKDGDSDEASDDMVTFTVLGTAFPSLIPTTVMAMRGASGSRSAFDILPAVWLCSLLLSFFAVLLSRGICKSKKPPSREKMT